MHGLAAGVQIQCVDVPPLQVVHGPGVGVEEHGVGQAAVAGQRRGHLGLQLVEVGVAQAVADEEDRALGQQALQLAADEGEAGEERVVVALGDDQGVGLARVAVQLDDHDRVAAGVGQVAVAHHDPLGRACILQRALDQVVEVGGDPGAAAQAGQAAVVVGGDGAGRVGGFDQVAQELAAGALVLVVLSSCSRFPRRASGKPMLSARGAISPRQSGRPAA